MIPPLLRNILIIGIIIYFVIILVFLKNKRLELKYTLLWMLCGVIFAGMVIWPQLLTIIVHMVGIQDNMNGLFIIGFAFVIVIIMSLTSIVSRQSRKITILVQEIAILEKRIFDLENTNNERK
ncbi:MAG: DUF2304 domain-containing protein [Lachnospiraceae bacterium]|nr:DUF2304 domain-containing protein [Lachnospiraceae bacterium]